MSIRIASWRRGVAAVATTVALAAGGLTASSAATTSSAAEAAPLPLAAPSLAAVPVRTAVSLTFDDGFADQKLAASLLSRYGMKGTFFVPSGYLGAPGYLTVDDVQAFARSGHEIGGHSVSHPDLTSVSPDEAARQICQDRVQLTSWGLTVRSFAYPFAALNPDVKAAVAACGYSSARSLGDLDMVRCAGCVNAETLPPADPYETKAPPQVESNWTLADLKGVVTRAERTGGWTQLTIHHVCSSGCEMSVTPTTLQQFLQWLQSRRIYGTAVRTVGDAIGGAPLPVVAGPMTPPLAPGVNGVVNGGYEEPGALGTPRCWMRGGYGANTAELDVSAAARTGVAAGRVTVSDYQDGDAKWLPMFDLGDCAPSVAVGRRYSLRSWYTSTSVTQFAVYLRDAGGRWHYWTSSPWFGPTDTFAQAVWTTPEVPSGMTAMSFGLNLFSDGTLVTDDAEMYDADGAPPAEAKAAASKATAPKVSGRIEPQGMPTLER